LAELKIDQEDSQNLCVCDDGEEESDAEEEEDDDSTSEK
jgi:hypothetical protein